MDGFTTKRRIGGVIFHLYSDAAELYDKHFYTLDYKQQDLSETLAEELLIDINPSKPLISKRKILKALSLVVN